MMVYDFRSTILLVPFADMINYDTSFRSISNARFRQRFADACRICQPFQSVAPVESGILFLRELHISAGIALVASVWATATQSSISARGQHHSFITDQLFQDHQFRWRLESVSSCSWRPPPPQSFQYYRYVGGCRLRGNRFQDIFIQCFLRESVWNDASNQFGYLFRQRYWHESCRCFYMCIGGLSG